MGARQPGLPCKLGAKLRFYDERNKGDGEKNRRKCEENPSFICRNVQNAVPLRTDNTYYTHKNTTMTFKELSEARFSVRNYTDQPVSDEQLSYIIECTRLAPSAVNFQPWHFYVVTKPEDREKLHQCYARDWFRTAPMYIICCIRHDEAWVRKFDGKEHGNIDIAIATEHICLAAAEQGLGTCWVCNFDAALCHDLFALPTNEEAAVLIPVGHLAPDVEQKPKPRKTIDEIVTML